MTKATTDMKIEINKNLSDAQTVHDQMFEKTKTEFQGLKNGMITDTSDLKKAKKDFTEAQASYDTLF